MPWPGRNLITTAPYKDSFNYHFSGGYRNTVERTYGILIARFGILWHPLDYDLQVIPFVFYGLCRLHNFLIDTGKDEECPVVATGLGYYGSRKNDRNRVHEGQEAGGFGHSSGYDAFIYHQRMVADDLMEHQRSTFRATNQEGPVESIRESITSNLQMLSIRRPDDRLGRAAA